MAKLVYYKQCHLQKPTKEGTMCQTSWIPEQFAVVGKVLKLKDSDGKWDNGWVVKTAGQNRVPDNEMLDSHSTIKGHRKMTGDALPKTTK